MQPNLGGLLIEAGDGVVGSRVSSTRRRAGQLAERLSAPPAVRVIDLSDVTFIDASGLRALIDATERRRQPTSSPVSFPAGRSALRDHRADRDAPKTASSE